MRLRRPALALFAALAAATLPVQAQKLTPGLWETQMQMKSAGGEVEAAMARAREQMAKMPPEQRKQMEQMMARQGVALGTAANSFRYCLSKEQAERGDIQQDPEGRCKRDSLEHSGNTTRFTYSCTNPASKGRGEVVVASDKAYTLKMNFETAAAQGRPQQMEMQQSAKWVAADCGTLKPTPTKP